MIIKFEAVLDETLETWIAVTNNKLNSTEIVKNPFTGSVELSEEPRRVIFNITPIYPDVWWIGIVPLTVMLVFGAPWWLYLVLTPLAYSHWQHTELYYRRLIVKSLRKFGYTHKVAFIR